MSNRFRNVAVFLAVATLLGGCSAVVSGQETSEPSAAVTRPDLAQMTPVADPRAVTGESEALLADTTITPVESNPTQTLPVTVTSKDLSGDTQQQVTTTDRVIGMDLSGSIAATLVGLGFQDRLVGRDVSTTFPGTEDLPVVTQSGHSVNIESILGLSPDLVITDGSIGPVDVVEQLRDSGVALVFVDSEPTLGGAASLAKQVAEVMGAVPTGQLLAEQLTREIEQKVAEIAQIAPDAEEDRVRMVFLYIRGTAGVYYLFGEESGADALIEAVGGVDVAKEIGWEGMKPLTAEAMVKADPDLILVMTNGLASVNGVDGLLAAKPEIALTQAGKNRRFVSMDDGEILSFGPRTADVLDALAREIYFAE